MSDELDEAIQNAATTPQSISVDGQSISNRSADDLLKLKKHEASNSAVNSDSLGVGRRRSKFPGASGLHS